MRFDVVSLFPEAFRIVTDFGITGRAFDSGIAKLELWNPRDFTHDRHRTVDDRSYGGGPGMVMKAAPLRDAVCAAKDAGDGGSPVLYLSPQGRPLDQEGVSALAAEPGLILVAGRYEGVDERFIRRYVDAEWSIGDYVLSGGELAAMVLMDAVVRLLPGALGHEDSAQQDSFAGGILDYPHYTRPEDFEGELVPPVLLSGNHEAIERWRTKQALGRTLERRPDLLEGLQLTEEQRRLLDEILNEERYRAKDGSGAD